MKSIKTLYLALPIAGMALSGCEAENVAPADGGHPIPLAITTRTLTSATSGETELPAEGTLYIFSAGKLTDSRAVDFAESADISVKQDDQVVCVAGLPAGTAPSTASYEAFAASTIASPAGANAAPVFYAGSGTLSATFDGMTLEMKRGVARLDIASADPKLTISEIIVEDAPAASFIVPADAPLEQNKYVTYTLKVGSDFDGSIEQAFTLFESAKPVSVRVRGVYDGDPMNIVNRIPVVERNKKYTLSIAGGTSLQSAITVADWTEGDSSEGILQPGETAIDLKESSIPAGVKIDPVTNRITFPHSGVTDMKVAFRTAAPLRIEKRLGELEKITITASEPKADGDGYLSVFSFSVPAQPKCAGSYDATIMLSGSTDFFIDMEVEPSPFQIPTVKIAGREWMCFNAVSADVDDQIFLTDGMTVDEMYNEHFADCVGNFFQYGKENPFSPWTSNDPTKFADQTRDVPWQTTGRMPLPPGFHVASVAEWQSIVPNNTNIPASYRAASGDSIHASFVTLDGTLQTPSAATNAQNFKMRYVLFESISTGAKLYIPFIGIKSNNKDEVPTQKGFRFETRTAYWIKEDRYIMLMDYKTQSDGTGYVNVMSNRWNYDGFVGVRGLKD